MARFFAKRLATLVLTLLVVSFLVFLTFELSPSDLARTALGQFATKAQLEAYHVEYGLDRPFFERYLSWLGVIANHRGEMNGLLQGNFGHSHLWRTPVSTFIWDRVGNTAMLVDTPWPAVDAALLVDSTVLIPVQVNGKKRAEITVAKDAPNDFVEREALSQDAVARMLDGKPPRKVIVVPDRIVNVVL